MFNNEYYWLPIWKIHHSQQHSAPLVFDGPHEEIQYLSSSILREPVFWVFMLHSWLFQKHSHSHSQRCPTLKGKHLFPPRSRSSGGSKLGISSKNLSFEESEQTVVQATAYFSSLHVKDVYMGLLLWLNEDFDDDLLCDTMDLLAEWPDCQFL